MQKNIFILLVCILMAFLNVTSAVANSTTDDDDPIPTLWLLGFICKDSSIIREYSSYNNWRADKWNKLYDEDSSRGTVSVYSSYNNWRADKWDKLYDEDSSRGTVSVYASYNNWRADKWDKIYVCSTK